MWKKERKIKRLNKKNTVSARKQGMGTKEEKNTDAIHLLPPQHLSSACWVSDEGVSSRDVGTEGHDDIFA